MMNKNRTLSNSLMFNPFVASNSLSFNHYAMQQQLLSKNSSLALNELQGI